MYGLIGITFSRAILREMYGAPDPNRTGNLLLRRQSLYPKLSYRRRIFHNLNRISISYTAPGSSNILLEDYTLKPELVPDNG